ncbi:hypothetical protein H3V53_40415 [Paraburkholderia bengalensis]|uniref:Uncharacterized protein n=1 Tax=Paraburkholderia bengalensis TaxID=2747562 RepID=A0ABU8J5W6_9BURK
MKNRFLKIVAGIALLATAISAYSGASVRDYIASRNKAVEAVHATYADQGNERLSRAADKSMQDVRIKLQRLVGPVNVKGFPRSGESVIGSRSDGQYEGLDGIAVTSLDTKTRLFVTTVPLMRAWLAMHRKDIKQFSSLERALGTEDFYNATAILSDDAAVYAYGEIPVTARAGGSTTRVILFALGQDDPAPNPPGSIAVAVMQDDRIYILTEGVQVNAIPACKALSQQGTINFEQCFAKKLPSQKEYARLINQAQGLVDRASQPQQH